MALPVPLLLAGALAGLGYAREVGHREGRTRLEEECKALRAALWAAAAPEEAFAGAAAEGAEASVSPDFSVESLRAANRRLREELKEVRERSLDRETLSRLAARLDLALASVAAGRLDVAELRELVRSLAVSPKDSLLLDGRRPVAASGPGAPLIPERPSALTSPATLARSLLENLDPEQRALPEATKSTALKPLGKARLEGRELRTPTRARKLLADWNGQMKKLSTLPRSSGKKGASGKTLPSGSKAPTSGVKGSPALPAASDKENGQPQGGSTGSGSVLKTGTGGRALRLSLKGKRSSEKRKSTASSKGAEAPPEGGLELRSEDEESFCGDVPSGLRQFWELDRPLEEGAVREGGLGLESHDLFIEGASPSKNSLVLTR